ncbi:MAG: histidine kinase [Bacteroidales bacterium]|nr:histidine kinase [Lentimicrobiaceae bacterium]MDD5694155.1 histidine kinase [Bacteroidales bacterium]
MKNLLLLILSLLSCISIAQTYYARNYSTRDGLPSNSIRCIFKDSRGQMWIGTDAGVCLFDGKKFRVYNTSHGLAGDRVWAIAEDGQGNMWFGTYDGGLSRFNNNTFTNYNKSNGLYDQRIRVLQYDSTHQILLIGSQNQFCHYDTAGLHEFNPRNGKMPENIIVTDFLVGDTDIYVCCFSAVHYRFRPGNEVLDVLSSNTFRFPEISSCYVSSANDTIFSYGPGKDTIILSSQGSIRKYGGVGQVFGITEDKRGDLWLAGWTEKATNPEHKGLFKIEKGNLIHVSEHIQPVSGTGYSIYYDQETDVIWYGSQDNGLYKVPPQLFEYRDAAWFGLKDLIVNDLKYTHPDHLWMLTDDGIFLVQQTDYRFWGKDLFLNALLHAGLSEESKLEQMRLWKNQYPELMKDVKMNGLQNYLSAVKLMLNTFYDMDSDSKDQVWISNRLGFFHLDQESGRLKLSSLIVPPCFIFDERDSVHTAGKWLSGVSIYPDYRLENGIDYSSRQYPSPVSAQRMLRKGEQIWYGATISGLHVRDHGRFFSFNQTDTTLPKVINELKMDQLGNILAGGANGEILVCDFKNDTFKLHYRIKPLEELTGNTILWMQCDQENFLWAGTNTGIHVIDLNTLYSTGELKMRLLDEEEGYTDFSGRHAVMDTAGMIWVGGQDHLIRINAPLYHQLEYSPIPVHLYRIDLFNQQVDWNEYSDTDPWTGLPVAKDRYPKSRSQVQLKYDQNYLTFYFRSGNLFNPGKDRFQYFLEGFDKEWSSLSRDQSAVYSHLPPGTFTLRVKGQNLNSGQEFIPAEFSFTIHRPWFRTWWFFTLLGLAGLFMVLVFHLLRIRFIRKREEERVGLYRKLAEIEMQALQAQMNPHFVFNAMNAIQNYILGNKVDAALRYLADFARIIRLTLDNASKKYISLSEEMDYIRAYLDLEKMRFGDKFDDEIRIDDSVDDSLVMIPPMILQPYIENAIRHGLRHKADKGRLLIECRITSDERSRFVIEDDGVGRAAASRYSSLQEPQHRSHGTRISEERIALLNNDPSHPRYYCHITDLFDEKAQPAGTRVEIWLPVKYE